MAGPHCGLWWRLSSSRARRRTCGPLRSLGPVEPSALGLMRASSKIGRASLLNPCRFVCCPLRAVVAQDIDDLRLCVHCWIFLPQCPDLSLSLGEEMDSPRGRLYPHSVWSPKAASVSTDASHRHMVSLSRLPVRARRRAPVRRPLAARSWHPPALTARRAGRVRPHSSRAALRRLVHGCPRTEAARLIAGGP